MIHIFKSFKLSAFVISFIPLIVPAIAAPAVFFYMKQYMEANIPLDLMESARIDGAGEFLIFNKIAFPVMAVCAIFAQVESDVSNLARPTAVIQIDPSIDIIGSLCKFCTN